MAIIVQSPGGHCYAFGHPSVDAVIDRYDNKGSTSVSVSQKQQSATELNVQYAKLEKELEREKSKYEMIRQDKIGKSSSSEFVPWYEQDVGGIEVEELEQYLTALAELKRKALVRAGDLADMKNASMLPLGPSTYQNNLPNTFHNDPLNMQTLEMNGSTNNQYLGDEIKILNNTMNGPTSRQYFGDGAMIGSNTMNGPTNGLDFGDRIMFQNNTMNGHRVKNIESNMMNGLANGLDFGDGNNHENNTMNGHLDFRDLGLNKFY
nr:transcription factor, MADS-box [Tanacetum cinerariifolium]